MSVFFVLDCRRACHLFPQNGLAQISMEPYGCGWLSRLVRKRVEQVEGIAA
jgi:hypothetical protein